MKQKEIYSSTIHTTIKEPNKKYMKKQTKEANRRENKKKP